MTKFECMRCWVEVNESTEARQEFRSRTTFYLENIAQWEEYVEDRFDDNAQARIWVTLIQGSAFMAQIIEVDYDTFAKVMKKFDEDQGNFFLGFSAN